MVISPYVRAGKIDSTIYDHTSLIATAMKLFAGNAWPSNALGKRAQVANTFESLLDLNMPPRMEQPDFTAAQNQSTAAAVPPAPPAPLSALQHDAVQHAAALNDSLPPQLKIRTDPSTIHDEHAAGVYVSKVAAAVNQTKGTPNAKP